MRITPSISKNVHQQFADYFPEQEIRPYLYLLSKKLAEGHICVKNNEISNEDLDGLYEIDQPLALKNNLVSDGNKAEPVVLYRDHLYFHRYFIYETIIVEKIKSLIEISQKKLQNRIKELSGHEKTTDALINTNANTIDWQSVAAVTGFLNQFTIITGGPGTGKTTSVSKLLKLLLSLHPELIIALAAPTGKAAARMAESIHNNLNISEQSENLTPFTIHRLLGTIRNSIYFKHNVDNPLPYDVVIIDESSMIDVALFAKLIQAVGPETRLIMLGDKNQLASVEAGSLFGDLCNIPEQLNQFSGEMGSALNRIYNKPLFDPKNKINNKLGDHIVELQKSYRFSDEMGIGRFSRMVLKEDLEKFEAITTSTDPDIEFDFSYCDEKFETFVSLFESYIQTENIAEALKKLNEARILCALREGQYGVFETNVRIEKLLEKKGFIKRTREFYQHRPVMITKNDYVLGLNNGDTGIIRKDQKGLLKAWFDIQGQLTAFNPSLINSAETAYCITIHKSQGSEFNNVMVLLPDFEVPVLTKELVYTAVTRARDRVLIQADKQILKNALTKSIQRGSGVKERL